MSGILSIALAPLATMLLASATPAGDGLEVSYLHSLSTSFGVLPLSAPALSYDAAHQELYVTGEGLVRVFNEAGMEVFTFGQDPEVGHILNVAALSNGEILALAFHESGLRLVRCSFRGEFLGVVTPKGLPAEFQGRFPSVMRYQGGKVYLADLGAMRVLVLDEAGNYVTSYDLAAKLELAEKRADTGIRGFNVDRDGNILFTIQPLFHAYVMSPEGQVREFGMKGGAPGKFNIVGGIARDARGNFYVADILKSAIVVFDPEYKFIKEFGYRGGAPGSLAAPDELAMSDDKLFVAQIPRRGVSVFQVAASSTAAAEGSAVK